jgi:hypothetical protein
MGAAVSKKLSQEEFANTESWEAKFTSNEDDFPKSGVA